MKKISALFLFYLCFNCVSAQQVKAWLFFTDKKNVEFNPKSYFTKKHFERNTLQGLPEYDWYDIPVNDDYVRTIQKNCDSISGISRWFNAVCVYSDLNRLESCMRFSFVKSFDVIGSTAVVCNNKTNYTDLHEGEKKLLAGQINRMQGDLFKNKNITGKGITVAIIDAGFTGYKKNKCIKKLIDEKHIKHTWDFIRKSENVDKGSSHGTAVLSCVGGTLDDEPIGIATEADFCLYRTEKALNEKFSEEEKWMMAMEEADKQGADVINTSLGYSDRRYFEKDMNGKKSLLSKAANIANRKGMLVVCSAGNEGDIVWKTICTPADADSALAVGAICPWTGIQASWSSYGPSSDWRVKPNVCAYGYVIAAKGSDGVESIQGTSFASPLTAGFAACVKQMLPNITAYELMQEIEKSADLFPYFDFAHGYGVPRASYFTNKNIQASVSFMIHIGNDSLDVIIHENKFEKSYMQIRGYYFNEEDESNRVVEYNENKFEKSTHVADQSFSESAAFVFENEPGYFYYKCNETGKPLKIDEYGVLNVRKRKIFSIPKSNKVLTRSFYYKGYTMSIDF